MILGVATIFFLAVLVWSGRVHDCLAGDRHGSAGYLVFRKRDAARLRTITSGRTALIFTAGAILPLFCSLVPAFALVFRDCQLARRRRTPSPSSAIRRPNATAASRRGTPSPTVEVADESGEDVALPTKIWTNLKDGQIYRTRLDGELLSLEAIATVEKDRRNH